MAVPSPTPEADPLRASYSQLEPVGSSSQRPEEVSNPRDTCQRREHAPHTAVRCAGAPRARLGPKPLQRTVQSVPGGGGGAISKRVSSGLLLCSEVLSG